ncbi:hypothetical protein EV202_1209 [Bacteroides heparinolyticus]|uniref:Lipoprotein n=1 Tax=Prevotella heparinolytica TaxID=28113 RepID=A0A4R2LU19_9BACE|nr:hypothetical protein [Bacteroides heparinolyticus]TCO89474.1 hypothetical protein EV202_1209 [Bacteroides heparinolyticus]
MKIKKICLCILLSAIMLGCEQAVDNELIAVHEKHELKQGQFAFDYEGCKMYGEVMPIVTQTRGITEDSKTYNLIIRSEYLKKTVVTQLVQTFNNDGSFILTHYVEGVKVASLFYKWCRKTL